MVENTSATPTPPPATPDRSSSGRAIAVVLCLVLAGLLTTPALVAYWGQRTLNDSSRYVETVGPLVRSGEVRAAVATKVTDAIEKQVNVEAILEEAFAGVIEERPRLQALVGPLAGAINGLIETEVRNFLASREFAEFWDSANIRLQQALIRVLKGEDGGAVSQQGDKIVLDVSEVIDQVKQRLVDRGLTVVQNLPEVDQDRQIVLFDAPQLKQARNAYALFNPLAKWLLIAVAGLYVAALVLSRRRARTTVVIGVLLAVNSLLLAFVIAVGRQMFIDALADTEFARATTVIYNTLLAYLNRGQHVLLWLALILVVTGCYLGRNAVGTAVRTTVCRGLETVGAALAGGPAAGPGRWVAANASWLRVAVTVLGAVVLLWGADVTTDRLFWATLLVVVLLAILQVLVGAGRAERSGGQGTPVSDDPVPAPVVT